MKWIKNTLRKIDSTKEEFIFNYYLCGTIILITHESTPPAHAQFLQGAENALVNLATNGQQGDTANAMSSLIKILMNILRLLYGIYMMYGVLSTWQSIQRDENWSKAATPPIFLLIAVTICDQILTQLFKPSGKTTG